jgi:hypothetical protein
MIPVETIPGMEGIKESCGGGEFKYDIFDIPGKNICKCHNVPKGKKKNYNESCKC